MRRWLAAGLLFLSARTLSAQQSGAIPNVIGRVVHSCGNQQLSSDTSGNKPHPSGEATVDTTGNLCTAATATVSGAAHDTLFGAAKVVHACGAQVLSSTGNPFNVVYVDTTGNFCTNATGGGGGGGTHDTIISISAGVKLDTVGYVKGGKMADSLFSWLGSTAPTVGSKTSANSIPVVIASDQAAIPTTGGASDSIQLRTGTKHAARVTVDSALGGMFVQKASPAYSGSGYQPISADTSGRLRARIDSIVGCAVAHNTCPLNVVVDSVITGLHLGLTTDSVGVGVYTTKTTPAFVNNTWNRLTSDTAGRLRVKIDTSVTINAVIPSGGAGLGAADSVQLRTGTKHAARFTMDSVIHPVYSDSTVLIRKNVELVNADTVYTRVSDTVACQIGAKSAADSIILPSHGGSTVFYMTSITVIPYDTLAIAASTTAYDSLTTTNFFSYGFRWGNAQTASFMSQPLLSQSFPYALKSAAAATATKFRLSAPGTGGYWGICVSGYYK